MEYLVIELQTMANGTIANIVTTHDTRNDADSKFHTVLAVAATSELPCHAAVLLTNEGSCLRFECYKHGDNVE